MCWLYMYSTGLEQTSPKYMLTINVLSPNCQNQQLVWNNYYICTSTWKHFEPKYYCQNQIFLLAQNGFVLITHKNIDIDTSNSSYGCTKLLVVTSSVHVFLASLVQIKFNTKCYYMFVVFHILYNVCTCRL